MSTILARLAAFDPPHADNPMLLRVGVRFIVVLDRAGRVAAVEHCDEAYAVLAPRVPPRSNGIVPNYLVDTSEYVLGLYNGPTGTASAKFEQNRRIAKFEAFRAKTLHTLLPKLGDAVPDMRALARFLDAHDPQRPDLQLTEAFIGRPEKTANAQVTFRVGDDLLIHNPKVAAALLPLALLDVSGVSGTCSVTGQTGPLALLHDKIHGVPGTASGGGALVSFNFATARSYGLPNHAVAPVSVLTMRRYTRALNHLLAARDTQCCRVGQSAYVFWGDPQVERQLVELLQPPFAASRDDAGAAPVDPHPFGGELPPDAPHVAVLGLAAAAGRISVTHWQDDPAATLRGHIARWVADLEWGAQTRWGEMIAQQPWRPSIGSISRVLCRLREEGRSAESGSEDMLRSRVFRHLICCALQGGPVPTDMQQRGQHLLRVRKLDPLSSRMLAGLLAAYQLRRGLTQDAIMTDPNYVLGQAYAVVERMQSYILFDRARIKDDVVPPIRARQHDIAKHPRRGFDMLMQAYRAANFSIRPGLRMIFDKRMREIIAGLPAPRDTALPVFPERVADCNLFYLGATHELGRLWSGSRRDAIAELDDLDRGATEAA